MGIQRLIQIPVHTGKAGAEPFQLLHIPQYGLIRHTVYDLIFARPLLGQHAIGIAVHRISMLFGRLADLLQMVLFEKLVHHCNLFHTQHSFIICSAQRIPSAAAERIPPA